MRVLIIGGTSFIGPYVVQQLSDAGNQVVIFHRGQTEGAPLSVMKHIHGDRQNLADFKDDFQHFKADVVLHMVADRAQEAWTLMRTFAGIAGQVIVISSQDVYRAYNRFRKKEHGPADLIPLSEDAPLREKLYPYRDEPFPGTESPEYRREIDDYDKILVERLVLSEPSLPGTVLRLPAVYGPNDPQHRMYKYIKRMDDQRAAILLEEKASQWRWTRGYVENVAYAVVLAVTNEQSRGKVYNVGEAEAFAEAEWVKQIGDAAGWHGQVVMLPNDSLPAHLETHYDCTHHLVANTNRIRQELGYHELISRADAIHKTVAWERAHPPSGESGQFDYASEDAALSKYGG